MGQKRMVLSQVSSEYIGHAAKVASCKQNSRANYNKVKTSLFRETHTPECGPNSEGKRGLKWGGSEFLQAV